MAVCPNGHDSASDDFCDVCGMRIGTNQARPMSPASQPAPGESCPRCGTIRIGQFCEACGFNFGTPGYTSARASFSPVGSPPRPSFTPVTPDGGPEPAPPPGAQAPQAPAAHAQAQAPQAQAPQALAPQPPAPQAPAPPAAEPSSPSRPSRASGGGRHSAPRPAYQPDPPAPSYQSATQSPPAPSYQSSAPSAPAPSYQPGPPSPQAPSYQPGAPAAASSFPYPQTTWTAAVGADRGYYEQVQAVTGPEGADVTFPSYYAERRFQLLGSQMRIGRRSVSRGLAPEIDLTGPPADPGISRLHAVLIAGPDGDWAVLDPGSANGTLLNGTEITIGTPVPLHDGDRINLGAWTSVTVHRD